MSNHRVGVAISTTGDEHRLGFLETSVRHWEKVLVEGDVIRVTVDGDEAAHTRVQSIWPHWDGVYRVGQGKPTREGHQGVAVSKNTGLELLMDAGVEHLFLCDDDTWPLSSLGPLKHTSISDRLPHSMVCWGTSRLVEKYRHYATWKWPRGVLLYQTRAVVEVVGGMDERFGPGGHEHVEWSRRIHQHGLTPDPFVTPLVYAERGGAGRGTRADSFWHCEDMRRGGETHVELGARRKKITSVRRKGRDWGHIEKIMVERDGDTTFVPFRASENGRESATLWSTSTGLGAGGEQ